MVKISVLFLTLSSCLVGFAKPTGGVLDDLESILTGVQHNTRGQQLDVAAVRQHIARMGSTFDIAKNVLNAGDQLSDVDAKGNFESLEAVEPTYLRVLNKFVEQKPEFDEVKASAGIKVDLMSLRESTDSYVDTLVSKSPVGFRDRGTIFKDHIDSGFAKVQVAYQDASSY